MTNRGRPGCLRTLAEAERELTQFELERYIWQDVVYRLKQRCLELENEPLPALLWRRMLGVTTRLLGR